MSRRVYRINPDPNLKHGTSYAYFDKGCRCDDCYGWWQRHHEHRKRTDPDYMARRRAAAFRYKERQRQQRQEQP
jgi:hypothetical protein